MTEDLKQLTADHRATLERVEIQERAAKKQRRGLALALITALGSGSGVAVKAWFDYRAERAALEIGAEEKARASELEAVQWGESSGALLNLDAGLNECSERAHDLDRRLSKAEVAIEFLTAGQHWIRRTAAERVEAAPKPMPARKRVSLPDYGDLKADPKRVEQRKAKILDELE